MKRVENLLSEPCGQKPVRESLTSTRKPVVARVPLPGRTRSETVCQLGTSSAARPETNRGTDVCPSPCGAGTPWVFALALPSIGCACFGRSYAGRTEGGTPTAVCAAPISGGSSAHLSSYVDTACNQRCQTTVVRASSKGNRADVGAIRWRARAIEYYPGRKDRRTAPRRLVRLERTSWLRDGRPSRPTSDPGRLVRPVKESPLVPRRSLASSAFPGGAWERGGAQDLWCRRPACGMQPGRSHHKRAG